MVLFVIYLADYDGLPATVTFDSCGRKCVNITIANDLVIEKTEMFPITLTTNDSLLILEPQKADISILDTESQGGYIFDDALLCKLTFVYVLKMDLYPSDPAVIGFEETVYIVTENVYLVEVCAIVYTPNISCPIGFNFTIDINTGNECFSTNCTYILYFCLC